MKKANIVLLGGILFCFIWACSGNQQEANQALADSLARVDSLARIDSLAALTPKIAKDTSLDNAARFIAGLPQLTENSFSVLQNDKYWTDYTLSMNTNWDKMHKTRLSLMAEWEKNTFSVNVHDSSTLFYPFSGPDFLHAYYLYPNTSEYVMAALEPIRAVAPLDTITVKKRDQFLDSLGNSLRDIFNKSYFITSHMQQDLRQIKGVLPPLYFFIERTGHELLEQKFITLDSLGNEIEISSQKVNWQKNPGVRLVFRNHETQEIKKLYYFSISISNGGLKERPEFVKFIARRAPFNTFVKSASYLMHKDAFTNIKDIILAHSNSVFQDDTGIPYKYFKRQLNWAFEGYGEYVKPVRDFSQELYQRDLDSAYKASPQRTLPFSLGYHWGTSKQNYMLIRKQNVAANK